MGKPLPLTLLGVINPCRLHDVREMTRPDNNTNTLSKHGGSLCYKDDQLRHSFSKLAFVPTAPARPLGVPYNRFCKMGALTLIEDREKVGLERRYRRHCR
jgi:hypothetical protein